jgi:hypothetical protein
MKTPFQVLPSLAFAALAAVVPACGPGTNPGTATVELELPPQWDGSAEVLVHHADGAQVSRAAISKPSTEVAIADGDTVTVAIHHAGATELRSFTAVGVGDVIRLPTEKFWRSTAPVAVHLPTTPGTDWWGSTPSSDARSQSPTLSMDVAAGRTSVPIVVAALAQEPGKGTVVAQMYGDKAASITATGIDLHQTVPWKMAPIHTEHAPAGAAVFMAALINVGRDSIPVQIVGLGGVPVPTGFGDTVSLAALTTSPTDDFFAAATSADVPDATVTLDLAVPAVPAISNIAVDLGHHRATWTATGGGDYDAVTFAFSPSAPADGLHWVISAPAGETGVTLPTLPADLTPPAAVAYIVTATSNTGVDGYDAWLAQPPPTAGSLLQMRDTFVLAAGVTTP